MLVECACGKGLTVLPHPLPDHNCLNYQPKFLMEVVGVKQGKKTHGFSPHWPRFDKIPPHPYPWEKSCPFLILVAAIVAGRVHLINYRCIITWWQNSKRMPHASIYHQWQFKSEHSIIDQRWGLGLELHTTIITIYTSSYTSNAMGSKPGHYNSENRKEALINHDGGNGKGIIL